MDELIRKQTVLNIIDNIQFGDCGTAIERLTKLYDTVENLSPADSVEVVRCKDCKHFDGECCDRYADETLGYSHSTQPNFFCACGERRTDV